MIIGFIIWSLVALVFVGIGISCRKSNEPIGFFTGCKPPTVKEVKSYNNAISVLWFVSAGIYEVIGVPLLFMEQNSLWCIPMIFAVVIGIIIMMVVYLQIEAKYKK